MLRWIISSNVMFGLLVVTLAAGMLALERDSAESGQRGRVARVNPPDSPDRGAQLTAAPAWSLDGSMP